ncbi:MAG: ribosome biogenesis GTP-binding protein YihA/YsxC [Pseudomonadota bacterium]
MTKDKIEYATRFFAGSSEFTLSGVKLDDLPPPNLPEISFCGRSNVGKSSLLNAMLKNKSLAYTSKTPGRTQSLNYFNLRQQLWLVDMPGYGYARVSKNIVQGWQKLIANYLQGRVTLRACFILIDARRSIQKSDQNIMESLQKWGVPFQTVITKIDKIPTSKYEVLYQEIESFLKHNTAGSNTPILTSAHKKINIEQLQINILERIGLLDLNEHP